MSAAVQLYLLSWQVKLASSTQANKMPIVPREPRAQTSANCATVTYKLQQNRALIHFYFSSAIFVTFVRLFTALYIPAWSYCKCPWWITIRTSERLRLHEKMQRKAHNDWLNSSFSCVNLFCFGGFWRIFKNMRSIGSHGQSREFWDSEEKIICGLLCSSDK